ncbi:MAG: hypothetical protein M3Z84_05650 [Actinomycetota bacterium]|nr:hypothetical protein [Actinomycetota bacterium]
MEQLVLLDPSVGTLPPEPENRPWRLDERTRAVGRQGLEEARRALLRSGRAAA